MATSHHRSSPFLTFVIVAIWLTGINGIVPSVKNMRPVVHGKLYRSATLDALSLQDAQALLSGKAFDTSKPLAVVIDLRNMDEIEKGRKERTKGAELLYNCSENCNLVHIPFLEDVNEFWEEAIRRMDDKERLMATLNTVFQGGALDRAAARHLERGGHTMLNTMIMQVGRERIGRALNTCMTESRKGPVIFHCQKGKDRTGVLGMLIQSILQSSEEDIVQAYALSGDLLGESEGLETEKDKLKESSSGLIDWSFFRGSPAKGMVETLEWTKSKYGSVESYLERTAGFSASQQRAFREQFDFIDLEST